MLQVLLDDDLRRKFREVDVRSVRATFFCTEVAPARDVEVSASGLEGGAGPEGVPHRLGVDGSDHEGTDLYDVPGCTRVFPTQQQLSMHRNMWHKTRMNHNALVLSNRCPICRVALASAKGTRRHVEHSVATGVCRTVGARPYRVWKPPGGQLFVPSMCYHRVRQFRGA